VKGAARDLNSDEQKQKHLTIGYGQKLAVPGREITNMNKKMWLMLIALALFVMPVAAFANSMATNWAIGVGGSVCFDTGLGSCTGTGTALVGTGLPVTSVQGISTLLNSGTTLNITGGVLNFSDGAYGGSWTWGSGGTLSITGCITGIACDGSPLLSDDFSSAQVISLGPTSYQVEFGQIQGAINPAIATYFGIGTSFSSSSLQLTLSDTADPLLGSSFTSINAGGTINAADAASENWNLSYSLVFFGLALALFGVLTRMKLLQVVCWS